VGTPRGLDQPAAGERDAWHEAELCGLVEKIAALQRVPGSEGEHAAAQIVADALRGRGAAVRVEWARVHGTYWVPIGLGCALGALAGVGSRGWGVVGGALSAASVSDDLELGARPLRRVLRQRTVANVVGEFGPEAPVHTLVVHAHHDAARTGLVFHPTIAKLAARIGGGAIERVGGTPAPMWGAAAGPALVALGAALGVRRVRRLGGALCAGYVAAMANIATSPAVPGANDNLSGVAVLIALAEILSRKPPRRLRVLLLSTGSEESFLEAMQRFGQRHFHALARESTTFLCVESVGSPELMLLSGEGLLRLHRYPPGQIRLLAALATESGIRLRDPFRYRLATDGQVPLRAGYPTAVISSMDWYKAPSNYHWPSDRPENLDAQSIAKAVKLAGALVAHLDGR
jgi:hypothetical protein